MEPSQTLTDEDIKTTWTRGGSSSGSVMEADPDSTDSDSDGTDADSGSDSDGTDGESGSDADGTDSDSDTHDS